MSNTYFRKMPLSRRSADRDDSGTTSHGQPRLARNINTFQVTMIGVGCVIGTGIFFVLTETVPKAGPGVLVTFVLVAVIAGLTALCYAELGSAIPQSGSAYSYTIRSLGELPAYVVGCCLILEYGVGAAATAVGWGEYFNALLQDMFGIVLPHALTAGLTADDPGIVNLPAVVLVSMCCVLLVRGSRESALANTVMVVTKLGVLVMFVLIASTAFNPSNLTPFAPNGFGGIAAAIPAIFFTFLGLDAISTAGEEVKDPARSIPRAVLSALLIVTAFYCLVALAALGAQQTGMFDGQEAGLAAILRDVTGSNIPAIVLSAGAVISIFSVTLINIYAQTRVSFAMARDGLLPPALSELSPRTKSPTKNTLITCAVIAVAAALLPLERLWDLVSIGTLLAFIAVSVAVISLRVQRPDLTGGFKVPGYPVTPLLSIAACVYVGYLVPLHTWLYVAVYVALALVLYFAYGRRKSVLRGATDDFV